MSERYIVIPNWETFQHYRDRSPLWIKNYTELMHDDAYRSLTGHQRGVLHGIWLTYASARSHLVLSTSSLSSHLGLRVMSRDLEALRHAGFIAFSASAPLAQRYPRVEKSREEKISNVLRSAREPRPVTEHERAERKELKEKNTRDNGYVENASQYTGCRIIRGEVGMAHVYDPLGTEPKPSDWPYSTPTIPEIREALKAKTHAA